MQNENDLKQLLAEVYQTAAKTLDIIGNINESQSDRIIFMGAHGTGKSTLANALNEILMLPVVESVARNFFSNWKLMESRMLIDKRVSDRVMCDTKQDILCSMSRWDFMRWVKADIPCIMTRCPLDTIAYAMADDGVSQICVDTNIGFLKSMEGFEEALKKSLFIYLPIEFELENDGTRPMDPQYQHDVDVAMRSLMNSFGIKPLVVSGTVDERLRTILGKVAGEEVADTFIEAWKESKK